MHSLQSLEAHVERVLMVADGPARLSGVLLLQDLFEVPGFLSALTPTQNYRLGGVLLGAYNYQVTGPGSKENVSEFMPALASLWTTWCKAVNPWALPPQQASGLPSGSYPMDVLRLGDAAHSVLEVPSLGWQLAVGAIVRGVPPALGALLALPSAPSTQELSEQAAGFLTLKDFLKSQDRSPSHFAYPKGLEATLLGLVLNRQMVRHSPRDGEAQLQITLALLDAVLKAGVDPTQPVVRGELHPLPLAQHLPVFDALLAAGALSRPLQGPADAIAAQVWDIPFLYQERWLALPPVLERWQALAPQWPNAQQWLWGFVDSFPTMPLASVSNASRPFKELLLPVMRVARAGHTVPQSLERQDSTWVGALFKGMTEQFAHQSTLRSRAFLAEDIEGLSLGQEWQARPGEAAWGAAALSVGLNKDVPVVGRSRKEALLGTNAFTAEELGDVVEALAANRHRLLAGLSVWARLGSALDPEKAHPILGRLFTRAVLHCPAEIHSVTYGKTDEIEVVQGLWKKAFDALLERTGKAGVATAEEALILIGLGLVLDKTSKLSALAGLSEPLPHPEAVLDALQAGGTSASASLAGWVRAQALSDGLPQPSPMRRGPRF